MPEGGIEPARGQEVVVVSKLHHLTAIDHGDLIHGRRRPQPVQDGDHRAARTEPAQGRVDRLFGVGVEGAGGLIQQEQPRVAHDGPGDGDPLFLAAGEMTAAGAHGGL